MALTVAIGGGGIGGLVLALALREQGVEVEVHEQAEELREIGAAVALSANGVRELHRLGLEGPLAEIATEPSALSVRRWDTGESIARNEMAGRYREAFGAPYYGVHRVPLLRILGEAFGERDLHLGRRCVGVDAEAGELRFEDGHVARADVVVGADGVHSAIRDALGVGGPAVFSGTVGYRGMIPIEELGSLPDPMALQFWAGPRAHLLHYAIDGGDVVNFLAVVRVDDWTEGAWNTECSVDESVQAFAGWHPAVTEMVGAAPEGSRWALHDHEPLERWHHGKAVLMGDAAHAMLPHQGQGANQTIEDVAALAQCLGRVASDGDVAGALADFDERRRGHAARVQALPRYTADVLHVADPAAVADRDALLGDPYGDLGWVHGHDVREEVAAT